MIKDTFEQYAAQNKVKVQVIQKEGDPYPHLGITIKGNSNTWTSYAIPMEDEHLLVFYTLSEIKVPEEKRDRVAGLLQKLNFELKLSGFYMNPVSGEIIVRSVQYMYGTEEEQKKVLDMLVQSCGIVMEHYYPEIVKEVFQA